MLDTVTCSLLAWVTMTNPVGRACVLPPSIVLRWLRQIAFVYGLRTTTTSLFAAHYLCSGIVRQGMSQQMRGVTRQRVNLSGNSINCIIVVPLLDEQHRIVLFSTEDG